MKKNLYNIMDEASEKELEAMLQSLECEIPEGVSAENIAKKVAKKRKNEKAKIRNHFIRFGAAAACLALIIAAVPNLQNIGGSAPSDNKLQPENARPTVGSTELGWVTTPSIAYADSVSYWYYLPLENEVCLTKEILFKLEKGKLKETWRELLAPFWEHCELEVAVADWKLTETDAKTEVSADGQVVTHTPGQKTLHLYLEGEAVMDDHTLKCLVNTIDSISYVRYIKLYYNGEPVAIDGKCPEEGFVNFHVDITE